MHILDLNLQIVFEGLTEHEEEILKIVTEKFFSNLDYSVTSWDGVEIGQYKKALESTKE